MTRRSLRTQFLVFALFGEYINPHSGTIWTSNLIALLDVLGTSERAVRSTFSRMTKKGWLVSKHNYPISILIQSEKAFAGGGYCIGEIG